MEEILGRAGIFTQWPLTPGKQNKYSHPSASMGDWFQDTAHPPHDPRIHGCSSPLYTMGKHSWPLVSVGSASVGFGFLNSRNRGLKNAELVNAKHWDWQLGESANAELDVEGCLDLQKPTSWTQRNWSRGDLKNCGVQILSKGMDAMGFQQIVAMWNANPGSLGLLTSQEILQIQILYEI